MRISSLIFNNLDYVLHVLLVNRTFIIFECIPYHNLLYYSEVEKLSILYYPKSNGFKYRFYLLISVSITSTSPIPELNFSNKFGFKINLNSPESNDLLNMRIFVS